MKSLNNALLINPYGLYNTGSICYMNSLLQVLASCTSILEYDDNESTILKDYIHMIKKDNIGSNLYISQHIVENIHRSFSLFGNGQESASEALILLLDKEKKLTELFTCRTRYKIYCINCNYSTEEQKDYTVIFNIFHTKNLTSKDILVHISKLNDYKCDKCNKTDYIYKKSKVTMLSEIIVCAFNIYHQKTLHNFPLSLTFPGKNNEILEYEAVGQIEHFGSLNGGHYTSRALRKNGIYYFNDSLFHPSIIEPTENTYLVFYHYKKI